MNARSFYVKAENFKYTLILFQIIIYHFLIKKTKSMKKLLFILFLLNLQLVFSNCSKDDDSTPTYFINAKINGDDFSSGTITANQIGPFINVTGLQGLSNALSLSIATSLTNGTYSFDILDTDQVAAGYGNTLPGGINVNAESGSMTITELDTTAQIVSGTFEFSGTDDNSGDTYNITSGEFNVNYN